MFKIQTLVILFKIKFRDGFNLEMLRITFFNVKNWGELEQLQGVICTSHFFLLYCTSFQVK